MRRLLAAWSLAVFVSTCTTAAGAADALRVCLDENWPPLSAHRLDSDPALLAAVDKALGDLMAEGRIAEFGRQAGLTYLPPGEPAIVGDVWQTIIRR